MVDWYPYESYYGVVYMSGDKKPVDYMASINKARRKRRRPSYGKYAAAALFLCVAAAGLYFGAKAVRTRQNNKPAAQTEQAVENSGENGEESISQEQESLA